MSDPTFMLDKQSLLDWERKQSAIIRKCLGKRRSPPLNDLQSGHFRSQLDILNLLREGIEEGDFDLKARFERDDQENPEPCPGGE